MGGMTPSPGGIPALFGRPNPSPMPAPQGPTMRPFSGGGNGVRQPMPGIQPLTGMKPMSTGAPVADGGPQFGGQRHDMLRNFLTGQLGDQGAHNLWDAWKNYRRGQRVGMKRGGVTKKPMVPKVGHSYAGGGTAKVVPGTPKLPAPDVIPAALSPNEVVLNPDQQTAVQPVPGMEHKLLPEQLNALNRAKGLASVVAVHPRFFRKGLAPRRRLQSGGVVTEGGVQPLTNDNFSVEPAALPGTGDRSRAEWMNEASADQPGTAFNYLSGLYGQFAGQGYLPSVGWSPFGATAIPTTWVNYPGVGPVPMAVPAGTSFTPGEDPGWGAGIRAT